MKAKRDFEDVFARGRKIVTSDFVMHYLPVQQGCVKFGICVGKTLGNAVKRNRMKRQIREVIRKIDFLQKGFHIVLVARRNLQNRDFSDIDKSINDILKKSCLI